MENVAYQISGQGLAGTCVAWQFYFRGIPFSIRDQGLTNSTRVAAGLINPITGKNFEPSWRIAAFYQPAIDFYCDLESRFNQQIWHPMPIQRVASSGKEWTKIVSKLSNSEVRPWLSDLQCVTKDDELGSVELKGGGWLDTRRFLKLSAEFFSNLSHPHQSQNEFECIRCEGSESLIKGNLGPHRCAKGEIITLRANWPETHIRIGAGGWLIPIGKGLFRAGSTYEWDQLDQMATDRGKEKIFSIIKKLGGDEFEVIDHVAGIRPISRRSQPWIGKNAAGEWIFNGLGSKGTLYAPRMAQMLVDWITRDLMPDSEWIYPFSPSN